MGDVICLEEIYITPSTIGLKLINHQNYKTGYSTPELSKTGQITPQGGFVGWFCLFLFYLFQLDL